MADEYNDIVQKCFSQLTQLAKIEMPWSEIIQNVKHTMKTARAISQQNYDDITFYKQLALLEADLSYSEDQEELKLKETLQKIIKFYKQINVEEFCKEFRQVEANLLSDENNHELLKLKYTLQMLITACNQKDIEADYYQQQYQIGTKLLTNPANQELQKLTQTTQILSIISRQKRIDADCYKQLEQGKIDLLSHPNNEKLQKTIQVLQEIITFSENLHVLFKDFHSVVNGMWLKLSDGEDSNINSETLEKKIEWHEIPTTKQGTELRSRLLKVGDRCFAKYRSEYREALVYCFPNTEFSLDVKFHMLYTTTVGSLRGYEDEFNDFDNRMTEDMVKMYRAMPFYDYLMIEQLEEELLPNQYNRGRLIINDDMEKLIQLKIKNKDKYSNYKNLPLNFCNLFKQVKEELLTNPINQELPDLKEVLQIQMFRYKYYISSLECCERLKWLLSNLSADYSNQEFLQVKESMQSIIKIIVDLHNTLTYYCLWVSSKYKNTKHQESSVLRWKVGQRCLIKHNGRYCDVVIQCLLPEEGLVKFSFLYETTIDHFQRVDFSGKKYNHLEKYEKHDRCFVDNYKDTQREVVIHNTYPDNRIAYMLLFTTETYNLKCLQDEFKEVEFNNEWKA